MRTRSKIILALGLSAIAGTGVFTWMNKDDPRIQYLKNPHPIDIQLLETDKPQISENDFKNRENYRWATLEHPGEIWSAYMAEEMRHTPHQWANYQVLFRLENGDWSENIAVGTRIRVPDIDGNASVFSQGNRFLAPLSN
jgi:hypothetical protein